VIGVEATEQSREDQIVVQLAPGTEVQPKSVTLAAPVLEQLATEDVADIAVEKSDTSFEQQIVIEYGRSSVQVLLVFWFFNSILNTRRTALDQGSRSDRPRYHAHTRWTSPLPVALPAPCHTPRQAKRT